MTEIWIPLLGGLALLVLGGDLLVRGAVRVAERLGVSPLVIGLTLVGFGTSMPELVTSVRAALAGSPGIAYGNIVGSNIANILLIVGASALLFPIAVAASALKRDAVVMLAVAAGFAAISLVMPMGRALGAVFVGALAVYVFMAFRQEKSGASGVPGASGALQAKEAALEAVDPDLKPGLPGVNGIMAPLAMSIAGLICVLAGGAFLVDGAVALAQSLAIPETVIGLTVVAIGTSMPELVTSVAAALRRQGDVAFGNIVGSNICNILGIGGVTALIAPSDVPAQIVTFDNLLMVAVSVLLLFFAATGLRIARWEGGVLLAGYAGYLAVVWP
ncbi:Inner membrane protein YrbG [Marinibacterium anthonyi]|nr:Inner membrane protein YrbG [Marinibacterium anthonyi]